MEILRRRTAQAYERAYLIAANGIMENPDCWRAHRALGHALLQKHLPYHALKHLRLARRGAELEQGIRSAPAEMLDCEIASALMIAGRPDLAAAQYESVLVHAPAHPIAGPLLEDVRVKLQTKGERFQNGHPLLNHAKHLEHSGDYAGAWNLIVQAKEQLKLRGFVYDAEKVTRRFDRYRAWCSAEKMRRLVNVRPIGAVEYLRPIFIFGYPRSGTTLIEQILCSHSMVTGGGELPFLNETAYTAPRILNSVASYPDCLDELLLADSQITVSMLRSWYLARAAERFPGIEGFLTDKMPLNETFAPLVHLIFPEAPKILITRDRRDVLMSNYGLFLTHGSHQACDPQSCWHHINLVDDLTDHHRRKIPGLKLMQVQFENLVTSPDIVVRALAQFCGLTFEPAMLHPESNPRYAHTASYSQVREPINARGIGRWRNYEAQLRAVLPEAFA